MIDDTIILTKIPDKIKGFGDFIKVCIGKITKGKTSHVQVYLKGYIYESTVPKVKRTKYVEGMFDDKDKFIIREPTRYLSNTYIARLKIFGDMCIMENRWYNFLKLFVLIPVYPTRKFWNKIKFVPFEGKIFGMVCSVFVDLMHKDVGIDLFKKEYEEYTAPVAYEDCDFWRTI